MSTWPRFSTSSLGMVQQRVLMAAGTNQFVFNCTEAVKEYLAEGRDRSAVWRTALEAGH